MRSFFSSFTLKHAVILEKVKKIQFFYLWVSHYPAFFLSLILLSTNRFFLSAFFLLFLSKKKYWLLFALLFFYSTLHPGKLFNKEVYLPYIQENNTTYCLGIDALLRQKSFVMKTSSLQLGTLYKNSNTRALKLKSTLLKIKVHALTSIKKRYPQQRAYEFLTLLLTGSSSSFTAMKEFKKVGLAHFIAISGWHFSILTLFLNRIFSLLPYKIRSIFIVFLLTCYLLFIGMGPSMWRAYLSALFFFISWWIKQKHHPLNTLCLCFIFSYLIDPLILSHYGFQLSYLATLGLLLFYDFFNQKLHHLGYYRTGYPLVNQIEKFFLKSLALFISVHLMILPVLIHYFGEVPLHGLFYSMLFPPLFCINILLFFMGLLVEIFSGSFGLLIHQFNGSILGGIMELLSCRWIPQASLYVSSWSFWTLFPYYCVGIIWGILLQIKKSFPMF